MEEILRELLKKFLEKLLKEFLKLFLWKFYKNRMEEFQISLQEYFHKM